MAFDKITDADLKDKGVVGLPDIPELSTAEMQAKFDELAKTVIIPKLNKLIDDLSASTASGNIGVTVPEGFTAIENIQSLLDEIAEIAIKSKAVNTLLTNISSVSNTVSDDGTALATCKAVFDYVIQMGGGDMTKAVYDTNNDGIVDDSEKLGGKDSSAYLEKASVVDSADEASAVAETGIPVGCKAFAELAGNTGVWIGSTTIESGSTYVVIDNAAIKADSLIDVYYAEYSKETVQNAGVTYSQTAGSLTLTFGSALSAEVTIANIKVVNV